MFSLNGALVVGYDLSNGLAKELGTVVDRDIAFVVDGKVYSSTFSETYAKQLRGVLFGGAKGATEAALGGSLTEEERQRLVARVVDDSAEAIRLNTDERGFAYEIGANVISARA